MALVGSNNEQKIWNYFIGKGISERGVAGLMGNLQAESGLKPNNLQNSFNTKFNMTDEQYTAIVNNGSYQGFATDSAGYGLAQWTSAGRKKGLYDFMKARKCPIDDLEGQLDYLYKELTGSYKQVLNAIRNADSIKQASDVVLLKFERPKDKSTNVKNLRASNGEEIYKRQKKGGDKMQVIIGSARSDENGKASGGQLGDQKQIIAPDYKGEVSMQTFYVHKLGWRVIRFKSVEHAKKFAVAMERACNNPNIGYDQSGRYAILKVGTYTTTPTECDCSSLVRQCFKEATGIDPGDFNTATEKDKLLQTGLVEVIEYRDGLTLYTGDILVTKTKGHTAGVTSGATRTVTVSTAPTKTENSNIEPAASYDANIAGKYIVAPTVGYLNIRRGAGKDKASIGSLKKGTAVQNYGYYTDIADTRWMLVKVGNVTGYCSDKYLNRV